MEMYLLILDMDRNTIVIPQIANEAECVRLAGKISAANVGRAPPFTCVGYATKEQKLQEQRGYRKKTR